jgi:hypothetical protein
MAIAVSYVLLSYMHKFFLSKKTLALISRKMKVAMASFLADKNSKNLQNNGSPINSARQTQARRAEFGSAP